MKHCRTTAALFALMNPLAGLSTFAGLLKAFVGLRSLAGLRPLVGIVASLAGATGPPFGGSASARGAEIPFTEHVISTSADSARSVFAIDVDGDGDIDVLSASCNDDKIAWYENDGGSPPTFTERVITDGPGGVQGFADCPYSVFATDVDGDGDIDVLSASRSDDKIAWYENDGASPPTFTERVITEDPDGPGGVQGFADDPWSVFAIDVDGDGDIDVLSAAFESRKVAWYESDGGDTRRSNRFPGNYVHFSLAEPRGFVYIPRVGFRTAFRFVFGASLLVTRPHRGSGSRQPVPQKSLGGG